MKLYELTTEYAQALSAMEEEGIDDQAIADTLEGLQGEIEDKAKAVAAYLQNLRAESKAMKEAEARISARRKSVDKKAARMEDYLRYELPRAGISKVETPEFKISVSRAMKKLDILDSSAIPAEYKVRTTTITDDTKLIKKALDAGQEVRGAQLIDGKPRLTIK